MVCNEQWWSVRRHGGVVRRSGGRVRRSSGLVRMSGGLSRSSGGLVASVSASIDRPSRVRISARGLPRCRRRP